MQIFISYASVDRERIQPIIRVLESRGYSVWWDRKIPPGRTFDDVIEEAIAAADCVVVIWSEKSVTSKWVRTEAGEGERRDILIPVLIDHVTIPLAFRRIEAANLVGWDGSSGSPELDILFESIERLSRAPQVAAQERPIQKKADIKPAEEQPGQSHERPAVDRVTTFNVARMFWTKANKATLTLSQDGLVFKDLEDLSYSYSISLAELKEATFSYNDAFTEATITTHHGKYKFGPRKLETYNAIIRAIKSLI